jgi:hypothetical protein
MPRRATLGYVTLRFPMVRHLYSPVTQLGGLLQVSLEITRAFQEFIVDFQIRATVGQMAFATSTIEKPFQAIPKVFGYSFFVKPKRTRNKPYRKKKGSSARAFARWCG